MHLLFLIPLTAAIVSGYLCKYAADEIADLAGLVAVVSLIFCLVLAPWQLQLLVLIFAIAGTRWLLIQNEYKLEQKSDRSDRD